MSSHRNSFQPKRTKEFHLKTIFYQKIPAKICVILLTNENAQWIYNITVRVSYETKCGIYVLKRIVELKMTPEQYNKASTLAWKPPVLIIFWIHFISGENSQLDDLYTRYRQRLRKSLFESGLTTAFVACIICLCVLLSNQVAEYIRPSTCHFYSSIYTTVNSQH